MSIEIDVLNGNASWPQAEPLMQAVWPREAIEKLPWGHIKWAHADLRVLIDAPEDAAQSGLACHVGIYFRTATWDGRKVEIGGIGGVSTRPDCRGRGYATLALNAAIRTLRDHEAVRFAMLFCEPHNEAFYQARGWHPFRARSMPSSPVEEFASKRWRHMCSISRASRATELSTYAACHGDPCAVRG
jgi:GNAT superfamily N-acetyltransferase